jgi:hypothetical protein
MPEPDSVSQRRSVAKLLFPVKPGTLVLVLIGIFLGFGCGYEPVHEARSGERLRVASVPSKVARADAVQEVMAGARAELSRSGALAPGSGYPRMVLEVLRVDEKSTGIAAPEPLAGPHPLARGSSVAVVGRAWVEPGRGAVATRDTGDVRRVERYASEADARIEAMRHDEAVRAAARELGRALARRVLGLPEPDVEPM